MTRRPCGDLAPGAKRGAGGVRSPGGPGGCGSRHPGTREPAWASQALGERGGASFGKPASRVLPSGSGSGFGVCVCSWPPPPGPSPGNMGAGGCLSPVRRLPAPVPSVGFSTSGRVGSSSGTWLARSRLPSAKAGRTVQGSRGGRALDVGRDVQGALCRPRRERSSIPELYFKDPPTHPIPFERLFFKRLLPTRTLCASSNNLARRNSRKWKK